MLHSLRAFGARCDAWQFWRRPQGPTTGLCVKVCDPPTKLDSTKGARGHRLKLVPHALNSSTRAARSLASSIPHKTPSSFVRDQPADLVPLLDLLPSERSPVPCLFRIQVVQKHETEPPCPCFLFPLRHPPLWFSSHCFLPGMNGNPSIMDRIDSCSQRGKHLQCS